MSALNLQQVAQDMSDSESSDDQAMIRDFVHVNLKDCLKDDIDTKIDLLKESFMMQKDKEDPVGRLPENVILEDQFKEFPNNGGQALNSGELKLEDKRNSYIEFDVNDNEFIDVEELKMNEPVHDKSLGLHQVDIKAIIFKKEDEIKSSQNYIGVQGKKKNKILQAVGNYVLKASHHVNQNMRSRGQNFYPKCAKILTEGDQLKIISPRDNDLKMTFKWTIKNESDQSWKAHLAQKKRHHLITTMIQPNYVVAKIQHFKYELIEAGETCEMGVSLDFSHFDFENTLDKEKGKIKYISMIFRILDEDNQMLGDPKDDNMVIFIKVQRDEDDQVKTANEQTLLAMASILLDQGYSSSFDRCLKAITICHGDIEEARNLLSQLTIGENIWV